MPMTVKFTQLKKKRALEENKLVAKGPSHNTLSFIKAFARVYHAESNIDTKELNAIILN